MFENILSNGEGLQKHLPSPRHSISHHVTDESGPCSAGSEHKVLFVPLFFSTAMSSLTQYLRSGPVLSSQNPRYDDKGRQLPFQESPLQRHERRAFVKSSLQKKRNPANWLHDKRLAAQSSPVCDTVFAMHSGHPNHHPSQRLLANRHLLARLHPLSIIPIQIFIPLTSRELNCRLQRLLILNCKS